MGQEGDAFPRYVSPRSRRIVNKHEELVLPHACPYQKVRLSFLSHTYGHLALTGNLPLLTIPLRQARISIWKKVVRRMTSEAVENTGESSFGEAQAKENDP